MQLQLIFFGYAVTVSKFSEFLSFAATVFFFPELILQKVFCGRVSCYGWSCSGIVPCAVAGVDTKRVHQDVSYASALGPFGSSAFFFCSLLIVGASVVSVSFSDQAPPFAGISFALCRELSGLHCDEDRARVLWPASLLQQHLLHAVGMRWDGTGSRQQFLTAWRYSQQRWQPGLAQ